MEDRPNLVLVAGVVVVAVVLALAVLAWVGRAGVSTMLSSAASPLPLPSSTYDLTRVQLLTPPPAPTLPPELVP